MSRLLCKVFGHRRNIHGIRRSGDAWRSNCIRCRQPLFRISRGAWQLSGNGELAASDDLDSLPLFDHYRSSPHATDR